MKMDRRGRDAFSGSKVFQSRKKEKTEREMLLKNHRENVSKNKEIILRVLVTKGLKCFCCSIVNIVSYIIGPLYLAVSAF